MVRLGHHLKIDNVSCKFYNYISFLAKLLNIETGIRVLIFNPIMSKRENFSITKLLYAFFLLIVIYKGNQVLNMNFSSEYIEIPVVRLHPNLAKIDFSFKGFPKIIKDVFISNNFDVPVWI